MKNAKTKRLQAAGWKVGSAHEFLGLSKQEAVLVEMKLALANSVKRRRQRRKMTQAAMAKQLGTSQSRLAKIEAADRSVSIDLLVRSLLALGASRRDLARLIGAPAARDAA